MQPIFAESELILNKDNTVYHLHLHPEEIAETIITVGDPDRVKTVSKYFDKIEVKKQNREFVTHTGTIGRKKITVISTGIGTDNIDIVMNELDALVNIDLKTRKIKEELTSLNIVRFGTSGSLQADVPCDSIVMSLYGLGLDNMLRSYCIDEISETAMEDAFVKQTDWDMRKGRPYVIKGSEILEKRLESDTIFKGFTGTAGGFYGPQGRVLRMPIQDPELNNKMDKFEYDGIKMTNLEMETGAIYGLGKLLGHQCLSLNAIIANRATGTFSEDPYKAVDALILYALDKLAE